jgi:hypothetical protein
MAMMLITAIIMNDIWFFVVISGSGVSGSVNPSFHSSSGILSLAGFQGIGQEKNISSNIY